MGTVVLYIAHSEFTMEKKEYSLSGKIRMKMSNRIKKLQQLKQLFVEMKKELDEVNGPVHHSYCHINLVKKTMYLRDMEKVRIYILYLPSGIYTC